ncbi:hypothetical protein [Edaphobacter modestus]|uniref:Uncharacterized protein n=1 Tax=Edaphobacter modestus TaxID=388466 RepID=A0A4V2G4W1_9BACT|nr:hypothetical protein [Edaphobacter modestus]RZU42416.1 hypothetical protein BDD14_3999 [Edaphobacter modestus]
MTNPECSVKVTVYRVRHGDGMMYYGARFEYLGSRNRTVREQCIAYRCAQHDSEKNGVLRWLQAMIHWEQDNSSFEAARRRVASEK